MRFLEGLLDTVKHCLIFVLSFIFITVVFLIYMLQFILSPYKAKTTRYDLIRRSDQEDN